MARLTGVVRAGDAPAPRAYVQVRNRDGDFVGEVRTDDEGWYVLHLVPGRWTIVSWLAGSGEAREDIEVGGGDLQTDIVLG